MSTDSLLVFNNIPNRDALALVQSAQGHPRLEFTSRNADSDAPPTVDNRTTGTMKHTISNDNSLDNPSLSAKQYARKILAGSRAMATVDTPRDNDVIHIKGEWADDQPESLSMNSFLDKWAKA